MARWPRLKTITAVGGRGWVRQLELGAHTRERHDGAAQAHPM